MKMRISLIACLVLLFSITGFAKKPIACPSQDFKVFLDAFAASTEVQKAFTQLPGLSNDKLTFPMIPNAKTRKSEGMNLKVAQLKKDNAKVVLDKNETDYKVEFSFEKKKCWMLVKAEDLSG